jgi:hypothetical protein
MALHKECYNSAHDHQSRGKPAKVRMLCTANEKCLFGGIIKEGEFYTWERGGSSHPPGVNASSAPPADVRTAPTTPPPQMARALSSLLPTPRAPSSQPPERTALFLAQALPTKMLLDALMQQLGSNLAQH